MNSNLQNSNHIFRVDKFKVPAASREEFLARVNTANEILRTLPGFIEDCFLEQRDAAGNSKIVTIAIWKDDEAFRNAKATVQEHYRNIGFNPGEIIKRLGIEADTDAYTRLRL